MENVQSIPLITSYISKCRDCDESYKSADPNKYFYCYSCFKKHFVKRNCQNCKKDFTVKVEKANIKQCYDCFTSKKLNKHC